MLPIPQAFLSGVFRGYYRYTALLTRLLPSPEINGRKFKVMPSVCRPLGNEQVLVDHIPAGRSVLEIGCGSGIITLFAALKSNRVVAVDISPDAVENTKHNLLAYGIDNVTVLASDGFGSVVGEFEVVISNPPWVTFGLEDPNMQWATSRSLIPSLFRDSGRFLVDDGLLAISCPAGGREQLLDLAAENGFQLLSAKPREVRKDLWVRFLTLMYLQVGFQPLVYVFQKVGRQK